MIKVPLFDNYTFCTPVIMPLFIITVPRLKIIIVY